MKDLNYRCVIFPAGGSKFKVLKKNVGVNYKGKSGRTYENVIVLQEI